MQSGFEKHSYIYTQVKQLEYPLIEFLATAIALLCILALN